MKKPKEQPEKFIVGLADLRIILPSGKRFDPSQPRDPAGTPTGGRWSGGAGVVRLTKEIKAGLVAANEGKTVERLRAEAVENQEALHELGKAIEANEAVEVEFEPPPPGFEVKTMESLERKIRDEGYSSAHEITDISRASFVVDSPAEADFVVEQLAERGTIYDKGWQRIGQTGYLDRKAYLQHPNGGLSEIQMVPRGVYQLKVGLGHRLYEVARRRDTPLEAVRAAARKQRTLYAKVTRGTAFVAMLGVGG